MNGMMDGLMKTEANTMQQLNIGFIGGGNMAEALIAGLRSAGHAGAQLGVSDPQVARREYLSDHYAVRCVQQNIHVVNHADVLILAVKPQQMQAALEGISEHLKAGATVISIAAGVSTASLYGWLGDGANVVRVMPNTPALVGAGMSVLFSDADEVHKLRTEYVLKSCGECLRVEQEKMMHAVTAVSGSGPAYLFLMAEVMQASGESLGLDTEVAAKLAAQTVFGAGKMLMESGRSAEALRHQVTSPGGTTQAALDVMLDAAMPGTVRKAVVAASKRSQELG